MFEPVWLGNYIIPRWEALLLVGGSIFLAAVAAFVFVLAMTWTMIKIYKMVS